MKLKISKKNKDINLVNEEGNILLNGKTCGLPLGTIVSSAVAQDDPCLHALDGSLLPKDGMYKDFCTWIINKKAEKPDSVPTCENDAEFDNEVLTYGQCGKFVIDEVSQTVRLPKITEFIAGTKSGKPIGMAELDSFKSHNHGTNAQSFYAAFQVVANNEKWGNAAVNQWGTELFDHRGSGGWGKQSNIDLNYTHSHIVTNTGDTETKPKNIRYPYYIVVAAHTKSNAQVNAEKYANDINALAGEIIEVKDKFTLNESFLNNQTYTFGQTIHPVVKFVDGTTEKVITTTGKPLVITGNVFCTFKNMYNGGLDIYIDGIKKKQLFTTNKQEEVYYTFNAIIAGLSAGTHTVQFKVDGNNPSNNQEMWTKSYCSHNVSLFEI